MPFEVKIWSMESNYQKSEHRSLVKSCSLHELMTLHVEHLICFQEL